MRWRYNHELPSGVDVSSIKVSCSWAVRDPTYTFMDRSYPAGGIRIEFCPNLKAIIGRYLAVCVFDATDSISSVKGPWMTFVDLSEVSLSQKTFRTRVLLTFCFRITVVSREYFYPSRCPTSI